MGLLWICLNLLWVCYGFVRVCYGFVLIWYGLVMELYGLVWVCYGFVWICVHVLWVRKALCMDLCGFVVALQACVGFRIDFVTLLILHVCMDVLRSCVCFFDLYGLPWILHGLYGIGTRGAGAH
jgi:hypothetical protein